MEKEVVLELRSEVFYGNILDIGLDNEGAVYNIYKQHNKSREVEYLCGKKDIAKVKENYYDNCVLFFSFSTILLKVNKRELIKKVFNYLNEEGKLHLWDVDKGIGKYSKISVKIPLPNKRIKEINIRDFNLAKDNSFKTIKALVEDYFFIEEEALDEGIFYIKASKKKKKEENKNIDKITEREIASEREEYNEGTSSCS